VSNPMPVLPVFLNDLTPLDVCIERMGSVRMGCILAELEQRIVLRTRLSEAQNHRCCWCGERFCDAPNRPQSPTLEHVQPLSLQGSDTPDNLAVACARCNRKRGVLAPDVFMAKAFALGWMGNRTPSPWSPDGAGVVEPPHPGTQEYTAWAA
jgi:HNH endonuclease